ncbi:hypothetical protein DSO57_1008945 [Entomophthora muscae]|uniref:Uncharacterized protein n=1 Tax=Entomophthora muscae TaxID=34485 RepID=A0ACC2U5A4_9FUNG|nr:hypothetical protein DSO57_1008945 [Entomophthora muscae]
MNQLRRLLQKTPKATQSKDNSHAGINQASPQDFSDISQFMREFLRHLIIQCYWILKLNVAFLITLAAHETTIRERLQTLSQFTETMEHSFCKSILQEIHHTGLSLEILLELHGKRFGHHDASCLEPWICPGLVMPGPEELQILLAKLSPVPLTVQKNQLLGFFRLEEHANLFQASPFAGLDGLGLPVIQSLALTLIP